MDFPGGVRPRCLSYLVVRTARWNPWTGWSFGFSYGWGPFRFGIGFGGWWRGGWWGPALPRLPGRILPRLAPRGPRRLPGRIPRGNRPAHYNNIYNRRENVARNAPRAQQARDRQPQTAAGRDNSVFADRDGNVYRRDNDGNWDRHGQDGWNRSEAVTNEARQGRPRDATRDRQPSPQQRDRAQQQPRTQQLSTGSQLERSNNSPPARDDADEQLQRVASALGRRWQGSREAEMPRAKEMMPRGSVSVNARGWWKGGLEPPCH